MTLKIQDTGFPLREFVKYLSDFPLLQKQEGCRYILLNAGLGKQMSKLEFNSIARLNLSEIVVQLAHHGTVEGEEALLRFLDALRCEDVGEQHQARLSEWMRVLREYVDTSMSSAPSSVSPQHPPATGSVSVGRDVKGDVMRGNKTTFFDMGRGSQIGTQINHAEAPPEQASVSSEAGGSVPPLSELHARLQRFDSVEIETKCMIHLPVVYDKFARGLRRDEMIKMILDHCRRNPEDTARLLRVLSG